MRGCVLLAVALTAAAGEARAEWCRQAPADGRQVTARDPGRCKPEHRIVPYEPGRQAAGSRPGSIRLSPDTDVTVSGRAQVEYGVRR